MNLGVHGHAAGRGAALVRQEVHPMIGVAIEGAQVQIAPVEGALPVTVQIPTLVGCHVHILVGKALVRREMVAALQFEQPDIGLRGQAQRMRSEEHTSELQSLMRISYAVFCLKKKKIKYT